ncbi:MAG: restriction endonuclease subunit S [Phocaeicola vulgatus]|nr:restriction endonuclease subunit S [Bacillota bacterium]MDY2674720.1 restriction endonuclease subunit S [Phocaeicola vulgatus]
MKVKIGELTKIRTGKLDANAASLDGEYPFFTCSKEPLRISTYAYDCECVLVAGNGDLNVKYYNGKFNAYQRTYIIEDNGSGKLYMPYLYYYMCMYVEELRKQAIGGVIKYIKLENLTNALIEIPELEKQKVIVEKLSKLKGIIDNKKYQMAKIDGLVKARFVELFGDTVLNPFGWEKELLGTICDVRDGTHDSPQYFNIGFPLVTSKNVTGGIIDLTDCSLICEKDYNKINERSKVDIGDIIMPMIGTVGKPVIVDIEPNFAIKNVSLIKFKSDSKVLNIYIRALLQSDYFDDAVLSKVRGGTQKFISLGDIRKLEILVPPLELQEQFAAFVEQSEKSKFDKHDNIFTRDKTYEKTTTNPN